MAISIITKLRELNVEVSLDENERLKLKGPKGVITNNIKSEILENKSSLIEYIKNNTKKSPYFSIPKAGEKDYYELSQAQKRLFFLHEFDRNSLAYNMPMAYTVKGKLSIDKISNCFNKILERYEGLRTTFKVIDGIPYQGIEAKLPFNIEHKEIDVSSVKNCLKEFIRPFDLGIGPLLRVGVFSIELDNHILAIDMHHIITDGVSQGLLLNDFNRLYNEEQLSEIKLNYKDYSEFQNSNEAAKKFEPQREFWIKELEEVTDVLDLPTDYKRPLSKSFLGNTIEYSLDRDTVNSLKKIAKTHDTSLFVVIFSVYNILLNKLSNQDNVVVGVPFSGRAHAELENIFGLFVNTLPLKCNVNGELTFNLFLNQVKNNFLNCLNNQDIHYDELLDELKIERSKSRNPLFDVLFSYESFDAPILSLNDLEINYYDLYQGVSKFDLSLTIVEEADEIKAKFEYCTELFKAATAKRIIEYFNSIINTVIADDEIKVSDISILSGIEINTILNDFNNSKKDYDNEGNVVELFEKSVHKFGHHTAIQDKSGRITYKELNSKANQVANYLKKKDIGVGDRVGIMFPRSAEMVIVILGIHKVGAAYVPIDANHPEERIKFISVDCNLKLILASDKFESKFGSTLPLQIFDKHSVSCQSTENPRVSFSKNSTFYIIYTSGSTGKPKGVEVTHASVINFLSFMQEQYPVTNESSYLFKTSYCFDVSLTEIYGWFMGGGGLVILEEMQEKDPVKILDAIEERRITHINFVPTAFQSFCSILKENDELRLSSLKYLMLAGESLEWSHLNKFYQYKTDVEIHNLYGPTEATVYSTFSKISKKANAPINIGKPISNCNIYILDKYKNIQPVGVPGEMYIGGAGVAKGYYNNAELTKESFSNNPFISEENIYRTGDCAKWTSDGNIEFIGRIDSQVKIRGFRIELGEIEYQITQYSGIISAIATINEIKNSKVIVAYYKASQELNVEELKNHLSRKLPSYMIPVYFVFLDSFPLTSSGKVARKLLPKPVIVKREEIVSAKSELEKQILEIWSVVLGIKKEEIGINSNFFELGGDSIKLIQIISKLYDSGYTLSVSDIYETPTISELCNLISELKGKKDVVIDQSSLHGKFSVSPIQDWFFRQNLICPQHFNQSFLLEFSNPVAFDTVDNIFSLLVKHHDSLRLRFSIKGSSITQDYCQPESPNIYSIEERKLSYDNEQEQLLQFDKELQVGMNLERGPLIKIGLYHLKNKSKILVAIHHLLVDGVSWRILLEDFEKIYKSILRNEEPFLGHKTHSFKTWAEQLNKYIASDKYLMTQNYWKKFYENASISSTRNDSIINTTENSDICSVQLSEEQTTLLLREIHECYNTQIQDVVLSGLIVGLNKTLNSLSALVDIEGHGREEIVEGIRLERTVGWFTSIFPIYLEYRDDEITLVKEVKEKLRNVPNNGVDHLLYRYESKQSSKLSDATISFNYLGQIDADLRDKSFELSSNLESYNHSPKNKRAYELDVFCIISDNRLAINVRYCKQQYSISKIQSLLENFKQATIEISTQLKEKSSQEYQVTPSDLTFKEFSIEQLERLQNKYQIQDIYPLTPMQEGIFYHYQISPLSTQYFVQVSYSLNLPIDLRILKESLDYLVNRHEILRSVFINEIDYGNLLVVLRNGKFDFTYIDYEGQEEVENEISKIKLSDKQRAFSLDKGNLLRLTLIKTNRDKYSFIWSFHHIIMDAWCLDLLIKELSTIYFNRLKGILPHLPKQYPYSNFINWLKNYDKSSANQFWKDYLNGVKENCNIPLELDSNIKEINADKSIEFNFDTRQTESISIYSSKKQSTVNTIFQVGWGILLAKYNNTNDVLFGSVVSGRNPKVKGINNMLGLFINTIPVRVRFDQTETVPSVISRVMKNAQECSHYHHSSLSEIKRMVNIEGELFDTLLVFENVQNLDSTSKNNIFYPDRAEKGVDIFEQTNFKLTVIVVPGRELKVKFFYDERIFSEEIIFQIFKHLQNIILQLVDDEYQCIGKLKLTTDDEEQKLLNEYNNSTEDSFPLQNSVIELFNKQAIQFKNELALTVNGERITYGELSSESSKIANYLINGLQIKKGDKIGVFTERSKEMVFGIFGIIKTGAAYVPIDPLYPKERISYIVKDSDVVGVITNSNNVKKIDLDIKILVLDKTDYSNESSYCNVVVEPNDIAYTIYTSGSTGKPKGVNIGHRSLVNLLYFMQKYYPVNSGDTYLLKTSYCFDVSITELFCWILGGGNLYVLEDKLEKDPTALLDTIKRKNVTHINFVPSAFKLFTQTISDTNKAKLNTIKYLMLAGEALHREHISFIANENDLKLEVINLYGPTEATVYSSHSTIEKTSSEEINIGIPISNTAIYILDENLNPQPTNIPGEIYIGGENLAVNYNNNEELTKQCFINNPFPEVGRIYKTGDIGRWLPKGEIEFLGRKDEQIKLRGYRVELGEIQAQLNSHSEINGSVVLLNKKKNDSLIIGYYLSEREMGADELYKYLLKKLPEYMIPSFFIRVEEIPFTGNGKVDKRALLKLDIQVDENVNNPLNHFEMKIAKLWAHVLDVELTKISAHQNFFQIGGHSLKAMELTNYVNSKLHLNTQVRDIFNQPTLKEYASYIENCGPQKLSKLKIAKQKEYYDLSPQQKRMYFSYAYNKESLVYNMPASFRMQGALNSERVLAAFQKIIDRHEILRTNFVITKSGIQQKVHQEKNLQLMVEEIDSNNIEEALNGFIKPFDLSNDLLLRIKIFRIEKDLHFLAFDMHHIISDAISYNIVIEEFFNFYSKNSDLPKPQYQYKDFSEWFNNEDNVKLKKEQLAYWQDNLLTHFEDLRLPVDADRKAHTSNKGASLNYKICGNVFSELEKLSNKSNCTMYITLLSILNLFLSKICNQKDIVLGTVSSGRYLREFEQILGMFSNTLVLNQSINDNHNFNSFINDINQKVTMALDMQLLPYEDLLSELGIERDLLRNPLFNVMFSYDRAYSTNQKIDELDISMHQIKQSTSKFDLTLYAIHGEDNIQLTFEYSTDIFKKATIEKLIERFNRLLHQILKDSSLTLGAYTILSEEDENELLSLFDKTLVNYPRSKSVVDLLNEQVLNNPDKIAVSYNNNSFTYRELDRKANAIASYINEKGISSGSVIGVFMPPSLDLIVSIIGILKSGSAYLPLDVDYPESRVEYMLKDSNTSKVLVNNSNVIFDKNVHEVIDISSIDLNVNYHIDVTPKPNDLCYIIYTSGTTGKPKGVPINHSNVVRLLFNDEFQFNFSKDDVWTMFHSHCFDFSVWEIFGALLTGGELVIVPKETRKDPGNFLDIVINKKVSILNQTPSAFYNLIAQEQERVNTNLNLKYVIFGGEALEPIRLKSWKTKYPEVKLINMYGITETTVHVTYKEITKNEIERNISNIGTTLPTLSAYVLDYAKNPVPKGVIGELYIGGYGLSQGYINKPELTATRFVKSPFGETNLYKTGDLVRIQECGELEYIGRCDEQIQLRGFRIELGEVEYQLNAHEEIKNCIVTCKNINGQDSLVAYYVAQYEIDKRAIREYLLASLPDYMIPSYFILINSIPLTSNGKIDKTQLPLPEVGIEEFVEARNEIEEELCEIWHSVLNISNVGITDNFFTIGGDSIKAISIVNEYSNLGVTVQDIFIHQTIQEFASLIDKKRKSSGFFSNKQTVLQELESLKKNINIDSEIVEDVYPMSDIQISMVYHSIKSPGVYHDQMINIVRDVNFSLLHFEQALQLIVQKHATLRTCFSHLEKEKPLQVIHKKVIKNVELIDISEESAKLQSSLIKEKMKEDKAVPFNLDEPGLWRFIIFNLGDNHYAFCFICHHAIIDGWSDASFNTELSNTYISLKNNRNVDIAPLNCSVKDHIIEQALVKKDETIKAYWKGELASFKTFKFSLTDNTSERRRIIQELDKDIYKGINELSQNLNVSIRDICLAAFIYTLKLYTLEKEVLINLINHNRPNLKDGDKVLGCFLNSTPFKINVLDKGTWKEFLLSIRQKVQIQKKYESLPFNDIIECAGITTSGKNRISDITFNMVDFYVYNQLDLKLSLDDISVEKEWLVEDLKSFIGTFSNTSCDFIVEHKENKLYCNIIYLTSFLSPDIAQKLVEYFGKVLYCFMDNLDEDIDPGQFVEAKSMSISELQTHNEAFDFEL